MGIASTINRACKQTAVYWANPVETGTGGKTYDSPVEILCRWEDKVEKINRVGARKSEEMISISQVYVLQDLDELGYLYLGDLDDLDSNPADPKLVDKAFEVARFDKSPALGSTTEFVRKAFL